MFAVLFIIIQVYKIEDIYAENFSEKTVELQFKSNRLFDNQLLLYIQLKGYFLQVFIKIIYNKRFGVAIYKLIITIILIIWTKLKMFARKKSTQSRGSVSSTPKSNREHKCREWNL